MRYCRVAEVIDAKLIIVQGDSEMKLKSMLAFSLVVSLTLVAIAVADEVGIGFEGGGYFGAYVDAEGLLVFYPYFGPDLLDVSPLGLSQVDWEIRVTATDYSNPSTYEFYDGWFTITGPNGKDSLEGHYSDWILNPETGDYILDWAFTGGKGQFDDFVGIGRTYGNANLVTGEAVFQFSGVVTDDDDNQGDDDE